MPRQPASKKTTVRTAAVAAKAPARSTAARPRIGSQLDLDLLPSTVGYFLRRLQLSYKDHFLKNTPGLDITPKDVGALFIVARNPGISPTQFGAAMSLDGAMTSLLLASLERRGLLTREKSVEDGRARVITLTGDGMAMITKLRRTVTRVDGSFTAALSEAERSQLLGLMARLWTARSAEDAAGDGAG